MKGIVPVLKLTVTVLVTVFILRAVGVSLDGLAALDLSTWELKWLPLTGSVLVLIVGFFVSGALWGRMVGELGGPRLGAMESVRLFMVANLGRYIPGKIWQIAGLAALAKERGVPVSVATAAAVLGQVIALVAATLVGLGVFFGPNEEWRAWGWIGVALGLVVFLAISIPGVLDRIVDLLARLTGSDAPKHRFGRSTFGVRWLFFYLTNWGLYAVAFWLLYLGLQPFEPFVRIGPAFAGAYVIGYIIIFAPAGAGFREGFLVLFLSPVTTPPIAVAIAAIARAWITLVEIVPAAAFWITRKQTVPAESGG